MHGEIDGARHHAGGSASALSVCHDQKRQMSIPAIRVLFVLAVVVVVVSVDVLFFRSGSWFWERLATNVGVVLLFGAFYFRFVATS